MIPTLYFLVQILVVCFSIITGVFRWTSGYERIWLLLLMLWVAFNVILFLRLVYIHYIREPHDIKR